MFPLWPSISLLNHLFTLTIQFISFRWDFLFSHLFLGMGTWPKLIQWESCLAFLQEIQVWWYHQPLSTKIYEKIVILKQLLAIVSITRNYPTVYEVNTGIKRWKWRIEDPWRHNWNPWIQSFLKFTFPSNYPTTWTNNLPVGLFVSLTSLSYIFISCNSKCSIYDTQ
jgi:hypothetical protein